MILIALTAWAADTEGERISENLIQHLANGRWSGVEREYNRLLDHHASTLDGVEHSAAAQAARQRGALLLAVQRLERVESTDPLYERAHADAELLRSACRLVALTAPAGTELTRSQTPFAPEQLAAVELATSQIRETGVFVGLLPAGSYTLGDQQLEVSAGDAWLTSRRADASTEP